MQVAVTRQNQDFYLQLTDFDTSFITEVKIPYQELDITATSSNISAPPQLLLDWRLRCSGEEQQAIINLRNKILSFDGRIKEEIDGKNTIRYGRGKSKPVAEIYYQKTKSKLIVFLWLPAPTSWRKEVIGRIRLWLNGFIVTDVGHVPEGIGKMKLQSEWDAMPREKRPGNYYHNKYLACNAIVYSKYLQPNLENIVSLEALVDLALTKWLQRI